MESSKVGYWLQVGANVGILAGLILVGVQMQQNTELLELQLMQQESDQRASTLTAHQGEDFAEVWEKHILDPENLTLGEILIMDRYYWGSITQWRDQYELYEKGLVDAGDWKRAVSDIAAPVFKNRFGMAYLEAFRQRGLFDTFPEELVVEINTTLADDSNQGDQEIYRLIQRLLER